MNLDAEIISKIEEGSFLVHRCNEPFTLIKSKVELKEWFLKKLDNDVEDLSVYIFSKINDKYVISFKNSERVIDLFVILVGNE